jgi:hypothetical protein
LRRGVEAQPRQDRGSARVRGMRLDLHEALVGLGDLVRVGRGLGAGEERRALLVGGQHDVDERRGARGRLLRDAPDPPARGQ